MIREVYATVNVASNAPVRTSPLPWMAARPDYGPKVALAQTTTPTAPLSPPRPMPMGEERGTAPLYSPLILVPSASK